MTRAKSFDGGSSLNSKIGAATATFGAVSAAVGTATNLASAISSGYSEGGIASAIRSIDLPSAGEAIGDMMSAVSLFDSNSNANDWRVRLSLPNWVSFKNSAVLAPLKEAGGLVFPYTPTISIKANSSYDTVPVTQTNYPFKVWKNSDPGTIEINAKMNVEDAEQAKYWIAAVHFLRSLAHQFSGNDPKAGNPPPIVFLNGYGNYVFKNVPVVLTSFSTTLPEDADYIACEVVGSAAGDIEGVADSIGGLADTIGGAIPGIGGITSAVSNVAGGVGQVAGLMGTFGLGGTSSGGQAHVPTKSSFSISLQPVYSRDSARKFSLDRFVTGGYLNNTFGYI